MYLYTLSEDAHGNKTQGEGKKMNELSLLNFYSQDSQEKNQRTHKKIKLLM